MMSLLIQKWEEPEFRQRFFAVLITLAIEALFIFALLTLGWHKERTVKRTAMVTFDVKEQSDSAQDSRRTKSDDAEKKAATVVIPPPVRQKIPPPLLPSKNQVRLPPESKDFIKVSKEDFAAMDISKFPAGSGAGNAQGSKGDAKAPFGPGEGPGGAPLYNAEWVREPTDAELSPYLSAAKVRTPGSWAMIACKTIENNRVENCQNLNESPAGSGLAKALRLAAWQFQVRAPRAGNKPLLGVWVRIRFDFRQAKQNAE
jgi:hypothetical protein